MSEATVAALLIEFSIGLQPMTYRHLSVAFFRSFASNNPKPRPLDHLDKVAFRKRIGAMHDAGATVGKGH